MKVKKIEFNGSFQRGETLQIQGLNGTPLSLAKANICLDAVATIERHEKSPIMLSQTAIAVAADAEPVAL